MKRFVVAALTLTLLVGSEGQGGQAAEATRLNVIYAGSQEKANGEWRQEQCRYQGLDRGMWTQREEDRTARCVLRRWSVPGGLSKFRAVISCESGWWRLAYNAAGPYVGLAQHALASWFYRVKAYKPVWWTLRNGWRNSRSQIVVTARMVQAVGWGPWSCA